MLVASKRHNAAKHVFGSSSRRANFEVQSCFYCSDFRLGGFAIVQLQLHGAESWTVNATHLSLSHVVHRPFTVTVSNSTQKKIMTVCTTEVLSVLITSMSRVTLHSAPHSCRWIQVQGISAEELERKPATGSELSQCAKVDSEDRDGDYRSRSILSAVALSGTTEDMQGTSRALAWSQINFQGGLCQRPASAADSQAERCGVPS